MICQILILLRNKKLHNFLKRKDHMKRFHENFRLLSHHVRRLCLLGVKVKLTSTRDDGDEVNDSVR